VKTRVYGVRLIIINFIMDASPVPKIICSPDSSTLVVTSGYVLLIFLSPSNILGSSDGFSGSAAIFITDTVLNWSGLNI
jgi:hypothetical protein